MEFEPSQAPSILGPLFTEGLLSDVPLFGPEKADVHALVKEALHLSTQYGDLIVDEAATNIPAQLDLSGALTVADKIKALRQYQQDYLLRPKNLGGENNGKNDSTKQGNGEPLEQRERHETFLSDKMESLGLPSEGHAVLDHVMLLRAKEKYLFSTETNQKVVADDPWLQNVWGWVAGKSPLTQDTFTKLTCCLGAEDAAADGGMMSHPLDLSYMGVYSVWLHSLGKSSRSQPMVDGLTVV